MVSRSSTRRAAAPVAVPTPAPPTPSRARRGAAKAPSPTPPQEDEPIGTEEEDEAGSELTPEPSTSRTSRNRAKQPAAVLRSKQGKGGNLKVKSERQGTGTGTDEEGGGGKSLRARKSVSYKEIPIEQPEEVEEEDEEEVAEDEVEAPTPRNRAGSSQAAASPSKVDFEKIGTGKGGFSVKGAAAAAARARWAKYRNEKAERGDDSDDNDRSRRRTGGGGGGRVRESRAAVESFPEGSVYEVKGKEYIVGDDELVLEDDEKGETKCDPEGHLLGGREWKLVTFTSENRHNPNRVYVLTIDAARACGYSDSLAFLRRCPQILKLACTSEERQMLIDIGRVSGNLRNRMVTMVTVKSVFKVMGARIIKNGKWVTDDYYEDKALAECAENGFTPYTLAQDDEISANAFANMSSAPKNLTKELETMSSYPTRSTTTLTPFYTAGGDTTHFAGSGVDPFSEAGWGNKRTKLKGVGVTEEDWMYKTAVECRMMDERLKEYRSERWMEWEDKDKKGWVWFLQGLGEKVKKMEDAFNTDKDDEDEEMKGEEREMTAEWLRPPIQRKRSALSQEIVIEDPSTGIDNQDVEMTEEPKQMSNDIVVQTRQDAERSRSKYDWGIGSWQPGDPQAVYEPHTHMALVPQFTQPHSSTITRLSHHPIIEYVPDDQHRNFAQSSISGRGAKGIASVEFVFEPSKLKSQEAESRLRVVKEAEEWERKARKRKAEAMTAVSSPGIVA